MPSCDVAHFCPYSLPRPGQWQCIPASRCALPWVRWTLGGIPPTDLASVPRAVGPRIWLRAAPFLGPPPPGRQPTAATLCPTSPSLFPCPFLCRGCRYGFPMAWNLRSISGAVRDALRFLDKLGGSTPGTTRGPAAKPARKPAAKRRPGQARPGTPARSTGGTPASGLTGTYPGDFQGRAAVRYAPAPNGLPEPGEIVWTWVPYEEDYSQGKDRPVLLVGTSGRYLLGLMLTSKDHDGDSRRSDDYVDIGTGPWDRQWRPSEAKLDRVLQISAKDIRREGAILDAGRFNDIAAALRQRHGWS